MEVEEVRTCRTVFRVSAEYNYFFLSPEKSRVQNGVQIGVQIPGPKGDPCFVNTRVNQCA